MLFASAKYCLVSFHFDLTSVWPIVRHQHVHPSEWKSCLGINFYIAKLLRKRTSSQAKSINFNLVESDDVRQTYTHVAMVTSEDKLGIVQSLGFESNAR